LRAFGGGRMVCSLSGCSCRECNLTHNPTEKISGGARLNPKPRVVAGGVRPRIGRLFLVGMRGAAMQRAPAGRTCRGRQLASDGCFQGVPRPMVNGSKALTVCGTTRWAGGSDGVAVAPARETTADVIMASPRAGDSLLRSDHKQNAPNAATMVAMITGTNS
jgi:hypothetical protein